MALSKWTIGMSETDNTWFLPGPEDTDRLASAVAGPLMELSREGPICVALQGELGVGHGHLGDVAQHAHAEAHHLGQFLP